ncbi:MAG: TonB family protein [Methylotenera sp.]|nr:TonB family protein [Methylotenera sp.]
MSYEQSAPTQKRLLGLILVLLFHVVLIYALVNGLAQEFVKAVQKNPLDFEIIEEVKLPPPPPPPPPKAEEAPKVDTPPPAYVPPAEVKVEAAPSQNTITSVTTAAPTESNSGPVVLAPAPVAEPAPPPPPKHVAERTKASLKEGCAKPVYPSESIDMEEEGLVTLGFKIDVDGHVVESKIIKSSGFTRLDDAAKEAFSRCEFNPATVDGTPEQSMATVPFEWKFK